jgi:hypothetical protein
MPDTSGVATNKKTKHPNRLPFAGALARLGVPSEKAPNGSKSHRVLLTREAAEDAIPTLIGMAVGFHADWKGHDHRQKCGVISAAFIEGDELMVEGYIFALHFPDVARMMRNPKVTLGMSYEMCDVHVQDMRAEIYVITECTFTGAAILLQNKAAYRTSRITIEASVDRGKKLNGTLTFIADGVFKIDGAAKSSAKSPRP